MDNENHGLVAEISIVKQVVAFQEAYLQTPNEQSRENCFLIKEAAYLSLATLRPSL